MALRRSDGARPSQLLASALFHAQLWHMQTHLRREQVRLQDTFNGRSGRDKNAVRFNMTPINPSVCPPSFSICPLQAGNPCSRTVTGKRCWLLCCLDFGNGFHYSHSQLCPLNPIQEPSAHSLLPIQAPNSPELLFRRITMVRHRMRSRHGGNRGGRARSQAAQNVEQPPPLASPPPSQANSPPPSPPCRHYPHNAFQLTHFRFQSNLNQPIITANITIIFSEEEEQHSPPARNSAKQPQDIHRIGGSHGSEQLPAEEGRAARRGGQHEEGDTAGDTRQPGGSSHGATISMAIAGSSSGTLQATEPPGGRADSDVAKEGEIWYGNTCPVIEETPDQDVPM